MNLTRMKSDCLDGRITALAHDAVLRVPMVACLILRRGFEKDWCLQAYARLVRGCTTRSPWFVPECPDLPRVTQR